MESVTRVKDIDNDYDYDDYDDYADVYNKVNEIPIDIVPVSAKLIHEAHPCTFKWSPPPRLFKGDNIKICCDDGPEFGERLWCIAVSDQNPDGSIYVRVNNLLIGNYKQNLGDLIPTPIFPEHVFDYCCKVKEIV